MLKRRYGDRSDWKRISKRGYAQSYVETEEFTGYITLLNLVQVTQPLWVKYDEKSLCIVDDGYMWLQHFPTGKNYSVTTMFDANGKVVQWYIDICNEIGIEHNVPWWDDLFLDIIVLPTGEIIQQDEDELEEALINGWVDQSMYNLAWVQVNEITTSIREEDFNLLNYSAVHKELLMTLLK
ncbi:DUF402 domain-containing protein [Psychrobacillus sp. NPDC096623]|uniref:DUF402 domain-containing protein n=1 Tax=Psychrobacillus sp. NPDC096623 TaxID=3364492 RepID=UPI0037F311E8